MTRPVPEWIGKTDTTPTPQRVKARIIVAQSGGCAHCAKKLGQCGEAIEFDHIQALILGGENREANLQALCRPCHRAKTDGDVAQKSTEARKRGKHLGLGPRTRNRLPGSRGDKWRRKINGEVVPRD